MIIIWGTRMAEPHKVARERRKEGGDQEELLSYGPACQERRTAADCSRGILM